MKRGKDVRIVAVEVGPGTTIRVDGELRAARRAVSCLVEPAEGARAVAAIVGDAAYLLHVVDAPASGVTLSSDRDVELRVGGGFDVRARAVDLASGAALRLAARGAAVTAASARAGFATAAVVAVRLGVDAERIESLAGDVERVAERTLLRVKRLLRRVDGVDELSAGRVDVVARRAATLNAAAAAITADVLVKGDAKQIQVG
ncbi:MAG TPA: DUF3540 domain-containing protein, partial [Minicystis sp.]|nr:DUF3540 domain-containing protein [Minicystis sp.]